MARKAIEFGVESRLRLELGAAQRVLGQVLEASGDREQPGAAPAQSPAKFEEIQLLPEPGRPCSRTGASSWVTMPPRAGACARAQDIFARIGAVRWVAEPDAAPIPR